jgi:hypothetical protein
MRTPRPVRDDQRQRLPSGGCGEQLAEPASSYPEQIGAFTHGFRLSRPTRIAPALSVKTRPAS